MPFKMIHFIQPGMLEWLVPGLLPEKITHLLRGLPKGKRRRFVPIPDTARDIVAGLRPTHGSLLASLEAHIQEAYGVRIERSDWRVDGDSSCSSSCCQVTAMRAGPAPSPPVSTSPGMPSQRTGAAWRVRHRRGLLECANATAAAVTTRKFMAKVIIGRYRLDTHPTRGTQDSSNASKGRKRLSY